ncbi:glycosyl hydrolase family 8 [Paenibacillus sp. 1011MAR3C5]|uniref:glycosyl hydrolase family 8 n=1 Tax=Paenibacillus sp. 1011MAR3C5 TaxID=1675787 RepID=UPI0015FF43F4|nr:glycosyl hydrolase family 8 [Paenibacillus sp. 1011MAR3C5]
MFIPVRYAHRISRAIAIIMVLIMIAGTIGGSGFGMNRAYAAPAADEVYTIAEWTGAALGADPARPASGGVNRADAELTIVGGTKYDPGQPGYVEWRDGVGTKYWLAAVSTKNFENLTLSSWQRSGNSGPKDFAIEVSTDRTTWTKIKELELPPSSSCSNDKCRLVDEALPASLANQDQVYIRWVVSSTNVANPDRGEIGEWGVSTLHDVVLKGKAVDGAVIIVDEEAPSVPANIKGTALTHQSIALSWDASTDNEAVTGYAIYRDNVKVGDTSGTTYTDSGLKLGTSYSYEISAYDARDNESGKSAAVIVKTKDKAAETLAAWSSFLAEEGQAGIHKSTEGVYSSAATLRAVGGPSYEAVTNSPEENSVQYQGWDNGTGSKYWMAALPTKGHVGIKVSSKQRSSGSGPADFKLQYSVDGTEWKDVPQTQLKLVNGSYATAAQLIEQPLPAEADDRDMLYIRWVVTSTTPTNTASNAAVGASGSSYISNVAVKGDSNGGEVVIPTLAILATPAHQAINVDPTTPLSVQFSKEIAVTGNGQVRLADSKQAAVKDVAAAVDSAKRDTLTITAPALTYGETYTVTIPKEMIKGADGVPLNQDYVWSFQVAESPLKPKLVTMSFNGDPRTSIGFAWYTDSSTGTVAEVAEASKVQGGIFPADGTLVFEGTEDVVETYMIAADRATNTKTKFYSHKAIADGLKPGTTYKFRLGNGEEGSWSKIGTFTTDAAEHQDYRFIVGADSQASTLTNFEPWADTFKKAADFIGDPKFIIVAGDLVDNGDLETQWQWMLSVAEDTLLKVPYVPVLGGHEVNDYDGDVTTDSNNFYHHFNVPQQVVEGTHEGSVYSFEYGDALYMVFNSQFEGGLASDGKSIDWEDPEFRAQLDWMRNMVAKSDKKWKFVTFHKSPYASGDNSSKYEDARVQFYRQHLIPVFDELGIDMVFEAHDHMYMRSFQMYGNEVVPRSALTFDANGNAVNPKGTIYLMPNALGNKFYQKAEYQYEFDENWNAIVKLDEDGNPVLYDHFFADVNEQPSKKMFTDVSITQEVLSFKSYTAAVDDEGKAGTVGNGLIEYDKYGIKRTDVKPAVPESVELKLDGTTVTLTWNTPATSDEPVRGFRIYEKNDKVLTHWSEYIPAKAGQKSYSFEVKGLNPAKKYDFIVKAVGARINSDAVEVTTIEGPVDEEPPSAPTGLKGTAVSEYQVNLSWTASSGNVEVSGYRVYRDAVKIATVAGNVTSYIDIGLTPGKTYRYSVKAFSPENIESLASNSAEVKTLSGKDGEGPFKPFPQHTAYAEGSIKPNHVTQEQMDATVLKLFKEWKAKYLKTNPYNTTTTEKYVWYADGSWFEEETEGDITFMPITVSEAHGYGMLILALMAQNDEESKADFDAMFHYFKAHPSEINPALMAWKQGDTGSAILSVSGVDSAIDGDLDIAYALLLAHSQWGSKGDINYLEEAKTLINAIMDSEVNKSDWTLRLADWATSGKWGSATRPSDWMLQHLKDFRVVTGDKRWDQVIDSTYSILNGLYQSHSKDTGLIPDFVIRDGEAFIPAPPGFLESENDGDYYYNSARTPWRLGTDFLITRESRAKDQLNKMTEWIRKKAGDKPANIKSGYTLDGTTELEEWSDLTFTAPFMVGAMLDASNQKWLNDLWDYNAAPSTEDTVYFSNNIRLLSMIVTSGNWWTPTIVDTEAPTAAVIDQARAASSSTIELSWLPSTDNLGVAGYKIYRDDVEIATTTDTKFRDTRLKSNTQYAYMVIAYDAAGNQSKASNLRLVKTPVASTDPDPGPGTEPGGNTDPGEEGEGPTTPVDPNTPVLGDITGHWAKGTIERAVALGLITGYPDGSFRPEGQITREEFAHLIVKALGLKENQAAPGFTDETSVSGWAKESVQLAVNAGIIQGYEDGTFRPKALISRAEMAVMIGRALHAAEQANAQTSFADNASMPSWAKWAIDAMQKQGIMEGKGNGKFAADDKTTRAEAAKVILKVFELLNKK